MSKRTGWVATALVMATVAGIGAAYSRGEHGANQANASPTKATATVPVERGDMVVTDIVDGTLGYTGEKTIASHLTGTITQLPTKGAVVHRGQRLFAVDARPVFLLFGKVPAYRTMTVGAEGVDVLQLERNLRAVGYGANLAVDDTYTSGTAEAVRAWQEDRGLTETGDIRLGEVVFHPGPLRIAGHDTTVGAVVGPGQPVITGSGLGRVVIVDLPVEQRALAKESARVRVTLPDGRSVAGRVTSVGNVVETSGGEQGEEEETTVEVKIRLVKPGSASRLDEAPVEVTFESERRQDVLSVPVNALIALPKGGYGVVVVDDAGRRTVTVDLGVFTEGRVEVTSTELRPGMMVEVPAP